MVLVPMRARPPAFILLLVTIVASLGVGHLAAGAQVPDPAPATPAAGTETPAYPDHGSPPTIAAAGDIACDPKNPFYNRGRGRNGLCQQKKTAHLIRALDPDAVLALGDTQYDDGKLGKYNKSYEASWGAFLDITRPAVGNHEYITNTDGYRRYFGARAVPDGNTYYSFDLQSWHIVALDSNCWAEPCRPGSRQYEWLKADLEAATADGGGICQLAYFHHPRFSSGLHGNNGFVAPLWRLLYRYGVDVVLNGHDHYYERFAPLTPLGKLDRQGGVREFIVGTGGAETYPIRDVQPHSQRRRTDVFGVLSMTLHPDAYDWRFVPVKGESFTDAGSAPCH